MEGNGEGESSPSYKLKANRKMKSRHRNHSNHFAVLGMMKYLIIHQSRYSQLSITSAFDTGGGCRKEERKRIKRVNQTPTHTSRTKGVNQVQLIPNHPNHPIPNPPNHPITHSQSQSQFPTTHNEASKQTNSVVCVFITTEISPSNQEK